MRNSSKKSEKTALFASALLVAIGGIVYELILGATTSYLIGDSILSFSLATGVTLFGMGIGSLISSKVKSNPATSFAVNEILLGLIGGNSVLILYLAFNFTKLHWLVMIVMSLIIGVFIGLEIPLLVRMFEKFGQKSSVKLLSRILAIDYFGALIASLIFPLILMPYLGLMRSAYLVAFLNISVAVLILFQLKTSKKVLFCGVIASIFLGGMFFASSWLEQKIDSASYKDPVIFYDQSAYQKIVMTNFGDDRRLFLNNHLQFSSWDEARYHETLAHSAMSSVESPKKVLVLGGGDGLLAREILKYPSVKQITLVDIDEKVTNLAKNHRLFTEINQNSLQNPKVKIVNSDAFLFVFENQEKFDAIFVDLVDPSNERLAKLYSKQFYAQAGKKLSKNGVLITQATSSFFTPNAFFMVASTLDSALPNRKNVAFSTNVPSFGEWGFVISVENSQKLLSQKLPENLKFQNETLLDFLLKKSPISVPKTEISTLINPKITDTYNSDMRQWRY